MSGWCLGYSLWWWMEHYWCSCGLQTTGTSNNRCVHIQNFVCCHRPYLYNILFLGARAFSNAYFGRGSGPIIMSYVGCNGLETHLANCSYSTPYCSHYEDAGVRCPGIMMLWNIISWSLNHITCTLCTDPTTRTANCTDGELRLRGGTTPREGRVEMCYERQWGTVCDNSWGTNDAKVACRQLGFSSFGNFLRKNLHIPAQLW